MSSERMLLVTVAACGLQLQSASAGWLDTVSKAVDTANQVTNAIESAKSIVDVGKGKDEAASSSATPTASAETQATAAESKSTSVETKTNAVQVTKAETKTAKTSRLALSEEEADDIANGQPISMDMDDLAARMKASSDYVLVDVRKPAEFKSGHIRGAKNVPFDDVSNSMPKPCSDKDKPIYLYCLSGDRAIAAGQYLIKNGYKRVYNCGSIDDWSGKLIKGK